MKKRNIKVWVFDSEGFGRGWRLVEADEWREWEVIGKIDFGGWGRHSKVSKKMVRRIGESTWTAVRD